MRHPLEEALVSLEVLHPHERPWRVPALMARMHGMAWYVLSSSSLHPRHARTTGIGSTTPQQDTKTHYNY